MVMLVELTARTRKQDISKGKLLQMIQALQDYWMLLSGAAAFVAGYSRLESKAKSNEEDIKNLANRINEQRKEDLARTESMLGEIRGDVKQLLQRGV